MISDRRQELRRADREVVVTHHPPRKEDPRTLEVINDEEQLLTLQNLAEAEEILNLQCEKIKREVVDNRPLMTHRQILSNRRHHSKMQKDPIIEVNLTNQEKDRLC